mmetsp:Transcript_28006/g.27036  ORF Transcript_28006/g.27036 Transcript_28006/m.27036 type:complete len:85 (-) Transcript_28006:3-257(-)
MGNQALRKIQSRNVRTRPNKSSLLNDPAFNPYSNMTTYIRGGKNLSQRSGSTSKERNLSQSNSNLIFDLEQNLQIKSMKKLTKD